MRRHPIFRRMQTLWRFVWPAQDERRYARMLRSSPQFDPAFYIASNPRLRWLFRRAPERHYVLFGEALGLSPNPHFAPRAYLFHNPDLMARGVRPLQHYIEIGKQEARQVLVSPDQRGYDGPPLPAIGATDAPNPRAPVAVVVHLYYHEMWPEFATALRRQHFDFDLYVTLTGSETDCAPVRQEIEATFPRAQVWALPNHGRDILPFVHLINAGLLTPYRAVCKLHSKKSPHLADGDAWRQTLLAGVLGDPDQTQVRLQTFLDQTQLGIWTADHQLYQGDIWWGPNQPRAETLLDRIGQRNWGANLAFPAGSIYWIKPALLTQIQALKLTAQDFEPEQALVDGTTAHAMERVLGCLAIATGLGIRETHQLDAELAPRPETQS
ncbi:rhamnan synthesis F family protein [Phaeobacter sp. NW0010-22]|uniref:rhamnan synthesis F family protein n=1 Tax=Phaeobacter sp. NW0010-22 TaxID=3135907 RepID=UPI00310B58AC